MAEEVGLTHFQNIREDRLRKMIFKRMDEINMQYAKGGTTKKEATFKDKVDAISKRLKGTKVPAKLQKEYGKKYDKKESIVAAQRIAGSILAKYKKK
jgi:hypothetical protein